MGYAVVCAVKAPRVGEQLMAGRWFEAHCPGVRVGLGDDTRRVAEGEFR